jgi:hypothetical protein
MLRHGASPALEAPAVVPTTVGRPPLEELRGGSDVATLGRLLVLAVPGPGFRGRIWACFGCTARANGPNVDPELPGRPARTLWDRISVRSHKLCGPDRPKTDPGSQARGPEAWLSNLKCTSVLMRGSRAGRKSPILEFPETPFSQLWAASRPTDRNRGPVGAAETGK